MRNFRKIMTGSLIGLLCALMLSACSQSQNSATSSTPENSVSDESSKESSTVNGASQSSNAHDESSDSQNSRKDTSTSESSKDESAKEEPSSAESSVKENSVTGSKESDEPRESKISSGLYYLMDLDKDNESPQIGYEAEVYCTDDRLYFRLLRLRVIAEPFTVRNSIYLMTAEAPFDKNADQTHFVLSGKNETVSLEFTDPQSMNVYFSDSDQDDERNGTYLYQPMNAEAPGIPALKHDEKSPDGKMDAGLAEMARSELNLPQDAELTAEDCKKITKLTYHAYNNPVVSLDGIEYFVNLKTVAISDSYISDLSPLSKLTELESIDFYNASQLTTLPDLSACKKLKNISINDSLITDIAPLARIENLEELTLVENYIKSIAPLKDNHTLKRLCIDNSCISDWETIEDNETLTKALMYDIKNYLAIENKAKEIVSKTITEDMSDLEKQIRLAEYIEDFMEYDDYSEPEEPGQPIIYYGIINNRGVCRHYAQTAKYLMNLAGLNVRDVSGGDHEWNLICLDGKWYEFDCTWDDGEPVDEWTWFNRSREYMQRNNDHFIDNVNMIPYAADNMPYPEYIRFAEE